MRHRVFGRQLHRTKKERESLFKLLTGEFIVRDRLQTTMAKAKCVQPIIEKLLTKAKVDNQAIRHYLWSRIGNKEVIDKLFQKSKLFIGTNGGYTKILKLGARPGDSSQMVLMLWSKNEISVVKALPEEKKAEAKIAPKAEKTKKSKEIK